MPLPPQSDRAAANKALQQAALCSIGQCRHRSDFVRPSAAAEGHMAGRLSLCPTPRRLRTTIVNLHK
jgi:hypothetical protein